MGDKTVVAQNKSDEKAIPRKRRRIEQTDDLEALYMHRLAQEEAKEERQRYAIRHAQPDALGEPGVQRENNDRDEVEQSRVLSEDDDSAIPQHEALTILDASSASDQANRTVFLSNVSTTAIKSKSSKKILLAHLASVLQKSPEDDPSSKLESLRFRSTAFASGVGPKRAAYAKKELMDDTTSSTNAYVVYSTERAARKAAFDLNGSIVLDRHLRADYTAQPAVIDHRRCVFVGNVSFVDKETVDNGDGDGEDKPRRAKAKEPADAEEGLWRTFSKAGKVESVRVVRDKETRVGKGFAYVQFEDENGVEAALLFNDKKFPPMLPRKLRVMRAKRPKQASSNHRVRSDDRKLKPNNKGLNVNGRDRPASTRERTNGRGDRQDGLGKPKTFIFEGHRASSTGGTKKPGDVKNKKRRPIKPNTRSSRRGTAFKAGGGKRNRET